MEHCVVSNFNFTINENFHFLQKIPGKISNERSWGKGGRGSNLHSLKASSNNNGSLSFRTRKKAEVKGVPTFHDTHIYTNETFNPDNVIWPCQSVQSFMPKNDQIMGLWDWELAHDFWNQRQIIMTNEPAWEVKTHSLKIAIFSICLHTSYGLCL